MFHLKNELKPERILKRLSRWASKWAWGIAWDGQEGTLSAQGSKTNLKPFNFLQPFLENIDRNNCNDGCPELIARSISQLSPQTLTLSSGGGSQLGLPCRGALLGHDEQEGGKKILDKNIKGK